MKNFTVSSAYLFVLQIFLISQVFEGVIKYVLGSSSLTYLLYIPKLLLILVIAHKVYSVFISPRAKLLNLIFALVLFLGMLSGVVSTGSLGQSAFGVYILLPLLFGLVYGAEFNFFRISINFYRALFYLAFLGLVLDFYYEVPWQGFSYEAFGRENEGSRDWAYLEAFRPAGFSSISWNAASHVAVFGLILLSMERKYIVKILTLIVMMLGVFVSTTKGVLVAVLAAVVCMVLPRFMQRVLLGGISVVSLALPIMPLFRAYSPPDPETFWGGFTYSFGIRLSETWPRIFEILGGWPYAFFGKGLGVTGGASFRNVTENSNAPDSFFLYTLVTFGVLGVVLFYVKILNCGSFYIRHRKGMHISLLVAFLTYGLVVSGVEFGLWGLVLGLLIGGRKENDIRKVEASVLSLSGKLRPVS